MYIINCSIIMEKRPIISYTTSDVLVGPKRLAYVLPQRPWVVDTSKEIYVNS